MLYKSWWWWCWRISWYWWVLLILILLILLTNKLILMILLTNKLILMAVIDRKLARRYRTCDPWKRYRWWRSWWWSCWWWWLSCRWSSWLLRWWWLWNHLWAASTKELFLTSWPRLTHLKSFDNPPFNEHNFENYFNVNIFDNFNQHN